jgi:polyhydroxyalkanoate depolymerase
MLLTVEGENDDICGIGQTLAAHELCSGLRPHLKRHYLQAGVGHFGVFSGSRWNKQIYPVLRSVIAANDQAQHAARSRIKEAAAPREHRG